EAKQAVLGYIGGIDRAGMQEAEMRGVDFAFEALQPIALALREDDVDLTLRQQGRLDLRQRRRFLALAHIDIDQAVALGDPIRLRLDVALEIRVVGDVRRIDAIALRVELPAVIEAAQAVLLVAPQKQRGAAVRTFVVHDPDPTRGVAERDQSLAEQHQPDRRAIALQFRRHRRRNPILPHQIAHDGARPDADQIFAVLTTHGGVLLRPEGETEAGAGAGRGAL